MNKRKIINDPVYGFIRIPGDLIFDVISHPFFQRLRRIRQLGLSEYVYPGALHTRFHHALGAMHLMSKALDTLQAKGHMIFEQEYEAAQIAILLHDIGHGPFSHTLEFSLFEDVNHEQLTSWAMRQLNQEFDGRLEMAIQIFEGTYPRKFLSQLVSSQLDMDRLDYLKRDCFFTGVQEGSIGSERIIKMLTVVDNELVVEEKGIYSIESFLSARRLMYWQVYLHKTAVCAEKMMIELIRRAKQLTQKGHHIPASPALSFFLEQTIQRADFNEDPHILEVFMSLDDHDIWAMVKMLQGHEDPVLNLLSNSLIHRQLFRIEFFNRKPDESEVISLRKSVQEHYQLDRAGANHLVTSGFVSNEAYMPSKERINILTKKGEVLDVSAAVDLPNIKALSKIVRKYYLCRPKNVSLQA